VHVLLIAALIVAGPDGSPSAAEEGLPAAPTEVVQTGPVHLHQAQPCVPCAGVPCRHGRISPLNCHRRVIPPYYWACDAGCYSGPAAGWYGSVHAPYYAPRYDYRRSFDYPWNGRSPARICPYEY
jgi:hypothetical protein